VLVRGIDADVSPGADDLVEPDVGRIEAGDEGGDAVTFEAQQRAGRLVDLLQLRAGRVDRDGHDLGRLGPAHVAGGVDAVDADVVERSAPHPPPGADVAGADGHRERRGEDVRLADPAAAPQVDHPQVDLFEVQAVGDHQLDAVAAAGPDHPAALAGGDRHPLLAQPLDRDAGGGNA